MYCTIYQYELYVNVLILKCLECLSKCHFHGIPVCSLLSGNVAGFVILSDCFTNSVIKSQLDDYHVPLLSITASACTDEPTPNNYRMRIHPSYMYDALNDVIDRDYWTRALIIYDQTAGS